MVGIKPQLLDPQNTDPALARTCARLVLDAYAMFDQWDQKRPDEKSFDWVKPERPAADIAYGTLIWATYRYAERLSPRHPHARRRVRWIDRPCPIGFLATAQDRVFVVFRGTQTNHEWVNINLRFLQKECEEDRFSTGKAHAGFLKYFKTARKSVERGLRAMDTTDKQLVFTGHSLGGAMSTLAALVYAEKENVGSSWCHYNFGAPRVFDPALAAHYESLDIPTFRIVNIEDVVTSVPLPVAGSLLYQHVGIPVCFSVNLGDIAKNHDMNLYLAACS
ncbi:MAG TPA: lipase family protein [Kiritimatiellia bacterium]|nr:lipase family protein [Kiritimatiellia bacterium]HMO99359.1 lipase family protein [Kiritimatiellia bacterium]HMP95654.1 lipase family protein [Kiritimatiellia bacterium]